MLTNKTRILRKTIWFGQLAADKFEKLVNGAVRVMPNLSEESKYDLALRIYDMMQPGALMRILRGEALGTLVSAA